MPDRFLLDRTVDFLNHGSFGALPVSVAEARARWQARVDAHPVQVLVRELPGLLGEALDAVGPRLGADPADLVFVPNATYGVVAALRSAPLGPGDEILTTNHRYGAVWNGLQVVAAERGARVVAATVPFPLSSPDAVVDAVEAAISPRTRLLVIDHITSFTALIFPVERLVALARARGVPVLVDGAHVPGQIPVDLGALGADWWTGNLHKWAFAPRATALLWVNPARQERTRPPIPSHDLSFRGSFHWTGTFDPSPWLCAPEGFRAHDRLGGAALMASNHEKVRQGRQILAAALGVDLPHPDDDRLYAAMATLPLPLSQGAGDLQVAAALHDTLFDEHRIEVPIMCWEGRTWVRISGQAYNRVEQYARLGEVLAGMIGRGAGPRTAV